MHINKMEAEIEKIQEMFSKDLQELKNKQREMNNTLEGIHSRITEAGEWINEQEDRMVEKHKIKKKETERNEISFRDL